MDIIVREITSEMEHLARNGNQLIEIGGDHTYAVWMCAYGVIRVVPDDDWCAATCFDTWQALVDWLDWEAEKQ